MKNLVKIATITIALVLSLTIIVSGDVVYNQSAPSSNDNLFKKELTPTYLYTFYTGDNLAGKNQTNFIQSARYDVETVSRVSITTKSSQWYNIYTFVDSEDKILLKKQENKADPTLYENLIVDVPEDAKYLFVSNFEMYYTTVVYDINLISGTSNQWTGKTMVWLGTSIPATARLGLDRHNSYPMKVAKQLGSTVYNEACGSSALHCKIPSRISPENPYGFNNNFEAASRCLTNTIEEMQWIIDNYDSDIWQVGRVNSMTPDLENYILSCSYQNKIDKYFENGNSPDLWVMDHGHNDWPTETTESYYQNDEYSLYSYQGAFCFIVDYIKQKDPNAQFVIIGEYENRNQPYLIQCMENLSTKLNIPLYRQWQYLPFSTEKITTTGFWQNGIWIPEGGSKRTIDGLHRYIPDALHPHTDLEGIATNLMANGIANWLKTVQNHDLDTAVGDVNRDGSVDIKDMVYLRNIILGNS